MKLPSIMWLVLIVMSCALGLCFLSEEVPSCHGQPHEQFPSMNQGGDASRHDGWLLVGWLYGTCQFLFLTLWLATSVKDRQPSAVYGCGAITVLVFSSIFWTYTSDSGSDTIALGFPLPTALVLFGIWLSTFGFVVLYVIRFDQWIFNERDQAAFEQIVATEKEQTQQLTRSQLPNDSGEAAGHG